MEYRYGSHTVFQIEISATQRIKTTHALPLKPCPERIFPSKGDFAMKHKIVSILLISAFALPNSAFALTSFSAILDPLNNSGVHGIANLTTSEPHSQRGNYSHLISGK